jgi:hypothetical protein
MDDPVRIAAVRDHTGELVGDAEAPLRLGQQHHPSSEVILPPSKAALTFFRATAGRSKGSGISSSVSVCRSLDRCATSGRGIMPHIHVSDYVRLLLALADEVVE